MDRTVKQAAALSGVSVRTLHYYDEIGLLSPSRFTEAGYRIYDESALERLQQILFYRELSFPLDQIRMILDSPSYDKREALKKHRELLLLKRKRLDNLLLLTEDLLKGEKTMSFEEFDRKQIEKERKEFAEEARKKYGETEAFQESEKRAASCQKGDWKRINAQTVSIFERFAKAKEDGPGSRKVQRLVREWQSLISKNFYPCTIEILKGLGVLYTSDERFEKNLDQYGEGTARLMSDAIRIYVEEELPESEDDRNQKL